MEMVRQRKSVLALFCLFLGIIPFLVDLFFHRGDNTRLSTCSAFSCQCSSCRGVAKDGLANGGRATSVVDEH
jgi:hypothetical protein